MISRTLIVSGMLLLPVASPAASLPLNPGLWETTMTRTNPMSGTPTTETTTECVTEEVFDPREMMKDARGCQLTNENVSGDTLTFGMQCDIDGGAKATIEGRFQTDGATSSGEMDMNMNMGGMSMSMDMNWTARRLGDC